MLFFQKLGYASFWYDAAMKATMAGTLRTRGGFTRSQVKETLAAYRALVKENRGRVVDVPSEYHVSWCSMILSVYRRLRTEGADAAGAVETTAALIFGNMGAESVAGYLSRALDRAKNPFAALVAASKKQEKDFFGATFLFRRPVDHSQAYHLRVGRCLYNDYFAANGAPELMTIACRWDMISWSKGVDPSRHRVRFTRPRTLGLDGVECEFNFEKLPEET